MRYFLFCSVLCFSIISAMSKAIAAQVELFVPEVAKTKVLEDHRNKGWFWVSGFRMPNSTEGRSFLYDQEGKMLGQLSNGFWFNSLVPVPERDEIVTVETYFSRGTRGERSDMVTLYDARSLSPKAEISIPSKRMAAVKNSGLARLTDDQRFLAVVNYTPAQSISIVDLDGRAFVEEIETPGCSVIYSGGNRSFWSICGNGAFMLIKLDDTGHVVSRDRSEPLFDPVDDFLSIAASRIGNTWYFVSRQNNVYAISMSEDKIFLERTFSLTTATEAADEWLISGLHHTAVHQETGRLFVLMHQGKPETFEEPGTAVWVYDVYTGSKINEIEMEELTMAISVDQHIEPRLFTLDMHIPVATIYAAWVYLTKGEAGILDLMKQRVNVYSADSGDHLVATAPISHGFVTGVQPW